MAEDHPVFVFVTWALFWAFLVAVVVQTFGPVQSQARANHDIHDEARSMTSSSRDSHSHSDSDSSSSVASVQYYGKLRGWYNIRKMLSFGDNTDGGQTKTDELNIAFVTDRAINSDFLTRLRNIAMKDNIDTILVEDPLLVESVRKSVGRKRVFERAEAPAEQIHNKRVMIIHTANPTSVPEALTAEVEFMMNIFVWETTTLLVGDMDNGIETFFNWGDDTTDSELLSDDDDDDAETVSSAGTTSSSSSDGFDSASMSITDDERAEAESTTLSDSFTSLSSPTWPIMDILIVLDPTSLTNEWITEKILHAWWDPSVYDGDNTERQSRLFIGPRFVVQPTSVSYVV